MGALRRPSLWSGARQDGHPGLASLRKAMDVDSEIVRTHLRRLELQEGIATYLARQIAALTVEKRTIEFDYEPFVNPAERQKLAEEI